MRREHTVTPPKREEREPRFSIQPVAMLVDGLIVTCAPLHAPGVREWLHKVVISSFISSREKRYEGRCKEREKRREGRGRYLAYSNIKGTVFLEYVQVYL